MSNEFEVDWDNDDFFSGDIDFDDDFDYDPYKGKGFLSSFGTGLLKGVVSGTVGSGDAIIRTSRVLLPKSFTNFLDKTAFIKDRVGELTDEFKENNYQSILSLQNIAKSIAERNKTGTGNSALMRFAEKDFSDWEGYAYSESGESLKGLDDVSNDDVDNQLSTLLSSQSQAFQNAANGINEMQTHIGSQQIAALKTGNRELINIQSGIRDLLDYNRRIQYKLDQTKIELLSRTYLVNVKFYKFMESSLHAAVKEMKRITENTARSEFEKTQEYNKKNKSRLGEFARFAGKRSGGLIGQLGRTFGRESRLGAYSAAGGILSELESMLSLSSDMKISKGFIGEQLGGIVSTLLINELPYLLNQGPFQRGINGILNRIPGMKNFSGNLTDVGNILSANANNGFGLLNQLAEGWQDIEENPYGSYDEYVRAQRAAGKRVMPERYYKLTYGTAAQVKGGINRYMSGVAKSRGTQYQIQQRSSENLTEASQWREINNITLNDVIPGWLSRIYESLEKTRTGNDDFTSPVFSYNRGQFVNNRTAQKIVRNDIFNHSQFKSASEQVNKIVNSIDSDGLLTDQQRTQLALRIAQDVDKGNGFNPYYYSGKIDGFDPQLEKMVNGIIRNRFGISSEQQSRYENAGGLERLRMASTGFRGESAEQLNELTSLAAALKDNIPDIGLNFQNARKAGNENVLRDMGLIYTKDGVDQFNMDVFWNRMQEYIRNPNDSELRGDFTLDSEDNAGQTRGGMPPAAVRREKRTPVVGESQKQLNELLTKLTGSIDNLGQSIALMNPEKPESTALALPDRFDALTAIAQEISAQGDAHTKLLEKISDCVCRQVGGWGGKSTLEKEKIKRDETNAKKSIFNYLKNINPKGVINKGLEVLANNQPLVLGGILGGLGTIAFKDPKAAALVGAGIGVAALYTRLGNFAKGEMPNDDEDILDESGAVILYSAKLRAGNYYDTAKKKVIQSWKDISGAVYDLGTKTYTTVAQLTGKIFGPDGRALIIKGLSKVRDTLNGIWNKLDLVNNAQKLFNKGREQFYQQDVYVKGDKEPKLTRSGFIAKRYFCLNPSTMQPEPISGWNEIKGPVYELDNEGNLNQIVTELEFSQGLVTSSGVALDKLGKAASLAGSGAFKGLLKARDYAMDKAGYLRRNKGEVTKGVEINGVESRLDKIYYLLCSHFGVEPTDAEFQPFKRELKIDDVDDHDNAPMTPAGQLAKYKRRTAKQFKGMFQQGTESEYPNKIRLNSLEDKEQQNAQKKQEQLYDDIHAMREDMDAAAGRPTDKKEGKGLFGKLTSMLFGGLEMAKMLFTNPIGFMAKIAAGTVSFFFKSLFNSSRRLVQLGSLLFKGVLGTGSGIYKLLQWGFNGVMAALGKRAMFDRQTTSRSSRGRSSGGRTPKGGASKFSRFGNIMSMGAGMGMGFAGGAYEGPDIDFNDVDHADTRQQTTADGKKGTRLANAQSDKGLARAGGEIATRTGGKALGEIAMKGLNAARVIPLMDLALAGYDAYNGWNDDEEINHIFGEAPITGKKRVANAATEVLGLGGLIPMAANGLADLTGFDFLKQDGGMTRFIESGLNLWEKIPGLNTPLLALSLFDDKAESGRQTAQYKMRYAMYGLEKTDNALGTAIYKAEKMLEPFIHFDKVRGYVNLDDKAPIKDVVRLFCQKDPKEGLAWYKGRFEPVYKLWQSALRFVGFNNLDEFDNSTSGKVYSVANQVKAALGSLTPYPLDVITDLDENTAIMPRQAAEGRINEYLKALEKSVGKDTSSAERLSLGKTTVKVKTQTEIAKPVAASAPGDVTQIMHRLNDTLNYQTDEIFFKTPKSVFEIDISDLHKDDKTPLDELTLVRLGAYGNTNNDGIRIDTVLRLERYCEQFMVYQGGKAAFTGKISDIYSLFSNAFRVTDYWKPVWVNWFNKRFMPVLMVWYEQVYMLRNAPPKTSWLSLSKTNKYVIANAIIATKIKDGKDDLAIWNIDASPFALTKSGTDIESINTFLTNLENAATQAKIKTPELEAKSSQPINQGQKTQPITEQQQQDFIAKASGGIRIGGGMLPGDGSGMTPTPYPSTGGGVNAPPPGSDAIPFFAGEAGNYSGTPDTNFNPSSITQGDKGFKISETEAIKTILNEFVKAGITDNRVLAFALANAKAETDFQGSAENMNYPADRLIEIFRSTFGRDPSLAYKFGRVGSKPADQKAIANIAYGRRGGNQGGDDGWNYRGRGYTQLTFKNNYKAVADAVGDPTIASNPEKLSKDPVAAADSAVGFFKINPKIEQYVKQNRIYEAAKVVGQHEDGARKKVRYYPDFLKRLTEGDLKGILDQKKETEGEEGESETSSSVPVPNIPDANLTDPTAQAASKVNAPPQPEPSEDAPTASGGASTSMPTATSSSAQSAPDNASSADTTESQAPTPSRQSVTPTQPAVPTEVKFPEGVVKVQDESVANAIVALAEALNKVLNPPAAPAEKRVGLARR